MSRRAKLVEEALGLLGVPYHHLGRNPKKSLDCAGVLEVAGNRAGYNFKGLPKVYSRLPKPAVLEAHLARHATRVADDDDRIGLVYLLRRRSGTRVAHYALRVNEHQVLHALVGVGVCLSDFEPDLVISRWELNDG